MVRGWWFMASWHSHIKPVFRWASQKPLWVASEAELLNSISLTTCIRACVSVANTRFLHPTWQSPRINPDKPWKQPAGCHVRGQTQCKPPIIRDGAYEALILSNLQFYKPPIIFGQVLHHWLVVSIPLKNMSSSIGMMTFPTKMEKYKSCSKAPPTSIISSNPIISHYIPWNITLYPIKSQEISHYITIKSHEISQWIPIKYHVLQSKPS